MTMRNSLFALTAAAAALTLSLGGAARADVEDRLYDFTDAYYLRNGVDPTKIGGRRNGADNLSVIDRPIYSFQRNVRTLLTLPSYDHSGNTEYFTVLGGGSTSLFTNTSAGRTARQIADRSIEYVFPRRGADPMALGATRQSVILDMRNGYFSNNPLGLWIHVWVHYTDRAFNTAAGQSELRDLARRNGLDLDGTPRIRTVGDIDRLFSKGLIRKLVAPLDHPLRYAICPVIKDPTDGGIAPDQFLAFTARADGTPLERYFLADFLSLQETGDWAD
jgi:hypothetical protein